MNSNTEKTSKLQKFWNEFAKCGWTVTPLGDDTYELQKEFSGENFTQTIMCKSGDEVASALALATHNFDVNEHIGWRFGQESSEVMPTIYDSIEIKSRLDELHSIADKLVQYHEHDRVVLYSAKVWLQTGVRALTGGDKEKGKIVATDSVKENEQLQDIRNKLLNSPHVYLAAAKIGDNDTPVFARFNLECTARYVDMTNGELFGDEIEITNIYDLPIEVRKRIVDDAISHPGAECGLTYGGVFSDEAEIERALGLTDSKVKEETLEPEKKKHKNRGR